MKSAWYGFLAVAALCLVSEASRADSTTDRLDRVERELNQLQRQVYRNEVGTPLPATPSTGAEPSGGTQQLDVQIRMDQIEAQMRALTGKLEEVEYNIGQLSSRLDKQQGDDEVRFQQIENGQTPQTPAASSSAKSPKAAAASHGAGDMDQPPSSSGVLVAPGETQPESTAPTSSSSAGTLPDGPVQEQYNYAFGILRRGDDYAAAEAAFKAFLQKHPTDPLAANAQYWLGETYFVRKDYASAASAFAEGLQKYPQGAKASDSLLKLGMALSSENRKQDACFAFARLEREFPTIGAMTKERLAVEKKHNGC